MKLIHLISESQPNQIEIYVDMDDVLTDFDRQVTDMKINREFMWPIINKIGSRFWSTMKWMPDGKALWNGLKPYSPTILSAPPRRTDENSKVGKTEWIKRELGNVPFILDRDKEKYAKPNRVLIDDKLKNVQAWRVAGGIGILHKNATTTLRQIRELLGVKLITEIGRGSFVIDETGKLWSDTDLPSGLHGAVILKRPDLSSKVIKWLMQKKGPYYDFKNATDDLNAAVRYGEQWVYDWMYIAGMVRGGDTHKGVWFAFDKHATPAAMKAMIKKLPPKDKKVDVEYNGKFHSDLPVEEFVEDYL